MGSHSILLLRLKNKKIWSSNSTSVQISGEKLSKLWFQGNYVGVYDKSKKEVKMRLLLRTGVVIERGPLGGTSGVDNILFEFLVFIWLSSPFFFPGNSSVTSIIPCTLSYSLVRGVRSGWCLLGGPPSCFKRVVSVLWCAVGIWAQSKSSLYLKSSPMTSNCHLSWNLLTSKIWSWGFQ